AAPVSSEIDAGRWRRRPADRSRDVRPAARSRQSRRAERVPDRDGVGRQRRRTGGHDPRVAVRRGAQLRSLALEGRCCFDLAVDANVPRRGAEPAGGRGGPARHCRGAFEPRFCRPSLLGAVHAGRPMSTAGLWDGAGSRLQSIGLHWATWSVIGTFILYVLGYLTIRFHLSVLGAGTDLAIVDERYLFAGAKFVVYLVSACTTLLLLLLVPAGLCYAAYRLLSRRGKQVEKTPDSRAGRFAAWCIDQKRLLVFGIVAGDPVHSACDEEVFLPWQPSYGAKSPARIGMAVRIGDR